MAATTERFSGTPDTPLNDRFALRLRLSGDVSDGDDVLLLSGDMTDGDDALLLSGPPAISSTSTDRI